MRVHRVSSARGILDMDILAGHPVGGAEMMQKKRLLQLLSDREWHDNSELAFSIALAFNQRMNEMRRAGEIDFETKRDPGKQSHCWYRLKPKSELVTESDGQLRFMA